MAGGPSNVLEQVNGAVAVYSRTGSLVYGPVTSAAYYGVPSGDSQFDPHTIFDPNGDRFIAIMEDGTTDSWIVSVTNTSDALSGRCLFYIGALNSGASGVDFPLVGVSPKYLLLTIRENGGGNRLAAYNLAMATIKRNPHSGTGFYKPTNPVQISLTSMNARSVASSCTHIQKIYTSIYKCSMLHDVGRRPKRK